MLSWDDYEDTPAGAPAEQAAIATAVQQKLDAERVVRTVMDCGYTCSKLRGKTPAESGPRRTFVRCVR